MSYHGFAGYECDECGQPLEEAETVVFLKIDRKIYHLHNMDFDEPSYTCFIDFLSKLKLPDRKECKFTQYFLYGDD